MPYVNKVMLMGNVTRDPRVKLLPSDTLLAEFGLACSRKFKTPAGEDREEVAFIDCSAFGKQAELIRNYVNKGKPLFVEGRLKFESWDGKNGEKRSRLSVVVESLQFVGPPNGNASRDDDPFDALHGREKREWKPDPVLFAAPRKRGEPVEVATNDAPEEVAVKVDSTREKSGAKTSPEPARPAANGRLRATVIRGESSDIPF